MENMPIYDDFEPLCRWQRDSHQDILELHLPGFKGEQMKVQRNDKGVVAISGERAMDNTRWSRFRKEIKISKNCKVEEINAKLGGDVLRVIFPKKIPRNDGIFATTTTSIPSNFLTFGTLQCSMSYKLKLVLLVSFVIAMIIAFAIFANKRCVCPC